MHVVGMIFLQVQKTTRRVEDTNTTVTKHGQEGTQLH